MNFPNSIGRVGSSSAASNGIILLNRILKEKKTELDGMVKWTSVNKREIGCLITIDKNGKIHLVDIRLASEQEPNRINYENPQIPEGHTFIGLFHTHIGSDKSIFSSEDFDVTRYIISSIQDLNIVKRGPSLGSNVIDIMISGNNTLHYVIINKGQDNYAKFWDWAFYRCSISARNPIPRNKIADVLKKIDWGLYGTRKYKIK